MIGSGIIEVYRSLNQPEAKHARVEVKISLRVTGDGGDMMNAADGSFAQVHQPEMANFGLLRKTAILLLPCVEDLSSL
jgi:hypothetical protein